MKLNNSGYLRSCIATALLTSIAVIGHSDDVVNTPDMDDTLTDVAARFADTFDEGALVSSDIIDCELSDGTATQCYEVVTTGSAKSTDDIGPFCPENFDSTEDESGIWLDGGTLYEADGDFFRDLPNIYASTYPPASSWDFADADGNLQVITDQVGCEAAARPDVDENYWSHCVQCDLDLQDPAILSQTFLIPVTPVEADEAGDLTNDAGVSVSGFQIAAAAPVGAILGNWTIAAFDDCGGHVNPHEGYHFHSSTGRAGCNSENTNTDEEHPSLIGYAMDGYGIYAGLDDTSDEAKALDECGGNSNEELGYHYHAASPELNEHIACFHGKTVETAEAGRPGGGPPPADAQ